MIVKHKFIWPCFLQLMAIILFTPLCANAANILTNPGFENGNTSGWSDFGCGTGVSTATKHSGSYSALTSGRTDTWNGISQSLLGKVSDGAAISVSGWARIQNASSATVKMTLRQIDDAGTNYHGVTSTTANNTGWVNMSGFFTLQATGNLTDLTMYFEGPAAGIEFYVDDVSVEVISGGDWLTEANDRIEQIRKVDFRIIATSPHGSNPPAENVDIDIQLTKHDFAFGSAITQNEMSNTTYLNYFKNTFNWAVMENASKWYSNEPSEDYVTYTNADNMYNFCNANNITMRGHTIFWAADGMVQDWIKALPYAALPATSDLMTAVEDRLYSAVNHFKGKFVHWDVNNEMCNNSFFKDRLGNDIRSWMFTETNAVDPDAMLFLNDYNVISWGGNLSSFKQMAIDLAAQGAPIHGLGVQCHMGDSFDPTTIKGRFDSLAELNLPIWVTEFDVEAPDVNIRANKLEEFYRIAFSHPSVEGILMWGFWENAHWRPDCYIVNADWTLNAAGQRYHGLMDEWTTDESAITAADGGTDFRGFYGTYTVTISPVDATPTVVTIDVTPGGATEFNIELTDFANTEVPSAPANLTKFADDQIVLLQWDDNAESDLDGYNVYRTTTPGAGYTKLNSSLLTTSNYTDDTAGNFNSYYYVVTAVDIDTNESDYSSETWAVPSDGSILQLSGTDFETGFGSWTNITATDTHDWTRDSGGTSTNSTGPAGGANGSLYYAYLECSANQSGASNAGDNAILESLDIAGKDRVLTFYYHMYGSNTGTLNVDVFDGTWNNAAWTISGQQHTSSSDAYTQATVDLSSYTGPIRIRLRSIAAGGSRGDMAIDDIEVTGITNDLYGDFTNDNVVNLNDLSDFFLNWLQPICGYPDLEEDCKVNNIEFSELRYNWLQ